MKILKRIFDGVLLLEPRIFRDDRGFFYEFYNEKRFREVTGLNVRFVQDNLAKSGYGVLRGMHFQKAPGRQAKLVSVIKGKILDVITDIRPDSPTFLQWYAVELSEENRYQLFIPKGFAHGYLSLAEETYVFYKTDAFYDAALDAGFRFNDPRVGIRWPFDLNRAVISPKDRQLPFIDELLEKGEL
ncbi:MAG: dTDP-4-dehydrorhamnose 3,5-epimerase [Chlorobi bacterium]|nr:dTDP-4-dehydrorhamnose 3,5-epimerase [Chlorobiota bacterium]